MAQNPPPNVKIYDRPPRRGPSPLMLVIALLVILILAFIAYKVFHHAAPVPAGAGLLAPAKVRINTGAKRAYWASRANADTFRRAV